MLTEMKERLERLQANDPAKFGEKTMYGRVTENEMPVRMNYIVFSREKTVAAGTSKRDLADYYSVGLVHENYIPEDAVTEVVKAVEEIAGIRKTQDDIQYDYMVKKDARTVVEMAVITFCRPGKGYKVM